MGRTRGGAAGRIPCRPDQKSLWRTQASAAATVPTGKPTWPRSSTHGVTTQLPCPPAVDGRALRGGSSWTLRPQVLARDGGLGVCVVLGRGGPCVGHFLPAPQVDCPYPETITGTWLPTPGLSCLVGSPSSLLLCRSWQRTPGQGQQGTGKELPVAAWPPLPSLRGKKQMSADHRGLGTAAHQLQQGHGGGWRTDVPALQPTDLEHMLHCHPSCFCFVSLHDTELHGPCSPLTRALGGRYEEVAIYSHLPLSSLSQPFGFMFRGLCGLGRLRTGSLTRPQATVLAIGPATSSSRILNSSSSFWSLASCTSCLSRASSVSICLIYNIKDT